MAEIRIKPKFLYVKGVIMWNEIKRNIINTLKKNNPAILKHPNFDNYLNDIETYLSMPNCEQKISLWPCLDDKTTETQLDKYYFYQDTWAAGKVFQIGPNSLVDVGSTALLVGVFAQRYMTISVDIRPLPVALPKLECRKGTIIDLPFDNNSVELLTSLCVIEHIGLGRYGDPLDPNGSRKAFKEITRVIQPGGHLLISLPLSHTACLLYNAHRVFERYDVLLNLKEFRLIEELYLYPEPGDHANINRLSGCQFCVWCGYFVKRIH